MKVLYYNGGNETVRKQLRDGGSLRHEGEKTRREGRKTQGRDWGEKKRGGEL